MIETKQEKYDVRAKKIMIILSNYLQKRYNKLKLKSKEKFNELERNENYYKLFSIIMNLDLNKKEYHLIFKCLNNKTTNDEILAMIDKYKPKSN